MSTALVWFRRDLRLADNPALSAACREHERVLPVFIHAPDEEAPWAPGAASRWWLQHSLTALGEALARKGVPLVIRRGPTREALQALIRETGATAVYWNRLYEPAPVARDTGLKRALREQGIRAESFDGNVLHEPWAVMNGSGEPYRVFTPYWKAVARMEQPRPLPEPAALPGPALRTPSLALAELGLLPSIPWDKGLREAWTPGEAGARARLAAFLDGIWIDYDSARNLPGRPGVSRLSPHLHFGELSPRQVWAAIGARCGNQPLESHGGESFLRELAWREFAIYVLWHWPQSADQPLQARFAEYPWAEDYARPLAAWQHGRTGYPLVDAGMRELWTTGWMHNRVRMMVASFLTKNLRIPWQEGARWFWDTLVDADLASNSLGWQWTAGCGVDAAPYFRVFNPVRQGEQYDGDGAYVRRWLPELDPVPDKYLHAPWALPAAEAARVGYHSGINYPEPLVDFAASRALALEGYERVKAGGARGLSA
ncbi:cryptochrome/photolyase family protein [Plasticicumulans sp.]|uniref:cryptochrome/photolyase family protein n=2 Tax=Plasticicumulans sp. TaxID=2307179 RepID=UPI002D01A279|nr:deoxyribodipyrimidine photo-lyase [Pseudomonadota bacterium]HNF66791.1 deoxyribodipyrimidine photo-lyase [Plasticicumulans sp.]